MENDGTNDIDLNAGTIRSMSDLACDLQAAHLELPRGRRTAALRAAYAAYWAILPSKLDAILAFLEYRAEVGTLPGGDIEAAVAQNRPRPIRKFSGGVAMLPLIGVLSQRQDMMTDTSGGTSVERFAKSFKTALDDERVGVIGMEVDTPGGPISLIPELSKMIFDARERKPVVAIVNTMAASGGLWLATSASEVSITPSGEMGSIGVVAMHTDESVAAEQAGRKTTLISAGEKKVDGNPFEPLSDTAREDIQAQVDIFHGMFISAVARNRGVSAADVRNGFGQGGMVGAEEAVKLGMADRVETMDQLLERLGARQKSRNTAAAAGRRLAMAKAGM